MAQEACSYLLPYLVLDGNCQWSDFKILIDFFITLTSNLCWSAAATNMPHSNPQTQSCFIADFGSHAACLWVSDGKRLHCWQFDPVFQLEMAHLACLHNLLGFVAAWDVVFMVDPRDRRGWVGMPVASAHLCLQHWSREIIFPFSEHLWTVVLMYRNWTPRASVFP